MKATLALKLSAFVLLLYMVVMVAAYVVITDTVTSDLTRIHSQDTARYITSQTEQHLEASDFATPQLSRVLVFLGGLTREEFTQFRMWGPGGVASYSSDPTEMGMQGTGDDLDRAFSGELVANYIPGSAPRLDMFIPVYKNGVLMGVFEARQDATQISTEIGYLQQQIALLWFILLGMTVIFLFMFFYYQVTLPLAALRGAAVRIGSGDFNASLPISKSDEIGDLARAFRDMARQLEMTTRMMREKTAEMAKLLRSRD